MNCRVNKRKWRVHCKIWRYWIQKPNYSWDITGNGCSMNSVQHYVSYGEQYVVYITRQSQLWPLSRRHEWRYLWDILHLVSSCTLTPYKLSTFCQAKVQVIYTQFMCMNLFWGAETSCCFTWFWLFSEACFCASLSLRSCIVWYSGTYQRVRHEPGSMQRNIFETQRLASVIMIWKHLRNVQPSSPRQDTVRCEDTNFKDCPLMWHQCRRSQHQNKTT